MHENHLGNFKIEIYQFLLPRSHRDSDLEQLVRDPGLHKYFYTQTNLVNK